MLEELDDGERLSGRTVLTGKVERSATSEIDAVSLEKRVRNNFIGTQKDTTWIRRCEYQYLMLVKKMIRNQWCRYGETPL